MDFEEIFHAFKKRLARYSLIESLAVIHAYMQNLQFDQPLPNWISLPPDVAKLKGYERHLYEWELDLLARELLQHAPMAGLYSLREWGELSETGNALKALENSVSENTAGLDKNILIEIGRLAYREFPWQGRRNIATLARYFKIFNYPAMASIVHEIIGLSPRDLYLFGLALSGHFLTNFAMAYPISYDEIGISNEKRKLFLHRFSTSLSNLKMLAAKAQWHDENFSYSQNPLKIYPIAHVGINGRHHIVAPIPTYLIDRFTAGVYYEIHNHRNFSEAFGFAFQDYIGEVLSKAVPAPAFSILREEEYWVRKDRSDSIDWIVSDETGHLFVECKTKRMRLSSKTALLDTSSLDADMEKMSEFIFQAYKAIFAAEAGHYVHWKPDGKPIYPAIVVLEEWYFFDFKIDAALNANVSLKLSQAGLPVQLLIEKPYIIISCADFEMFAQVVGKVSVRTVMSKKHERKDLMWNIGAFLRDEFGDQVERIDSILFNEDLIKIHPVMNISKV